MKPPAIKLVAMQEKHLRDIQLYAAECRVADTCNLPHPYPENGARHFYDHVRDKRLIGHRVTFAIEVGKQFCGVCGAGRIGDSLAGEVGYWIALPFWGRGIATQATRELTKHAFTKMKFHSLQAKCLEVNPASRRVLEKCGFRMTHLGMEQYAKWPDPQSTCFFELRRDEWKQRR